MAKSTHDFVPAAVRKARKIHEFLPAELAKADVSGESRDAQGRWTFGEGTAGGGIPRSVTVDPKVIVAQMHSLNRKANIAAMLSGHKFGSPGHKAAYNAAYNRGLAAIKPLSHEGAPTKEQQAYLSSTTLAQREASPNRTFGKRDVGTKERKTLAAHGKALPSGGFPIANAADLANAKRAIGRAKNPEAARALINRRAKELGEPGIGKSLFAKALGDEKTASETGDGDGRSAQNIADELKVVCEHACNNPPNPGEDRQAWFVRIFGQEGANKLHSEQLYHLRHLYFKLMRKPYHEMAKVHVEIAKAAPMGELKDGTVWGWASIIEKGGKVVTDHQGDRISEEELVKAAHDYMTNSRIGGALHMYNSDKPDEPLSAGRVVESVVLTHDLQKALGIDLGKVGWLVGYHIEDSHVRKAAASGKLISFSIGGKGVREKIDGE